MACGGLVAATLLPTRGWSSVGGEKVACGGLVAATFLLTRGWGSAGTAVVVSVSSSLRKNAFLDIGSCRASSILITALSGVLLNMPENMI